jgi:hypothetical protein
MVRLARGVEGNKIGGAAGEGGGGANELAFCLRRSISSGCSNANWRLMRHAWQFMALTGFSAPHLGQVIVSMRPTPFCRLAMRRGAGASRLVFVAGPASKPGFYMISRCKREKSSNARTRADDPRAQIVAISV